MNPAQGTGSGTALAAPPPFSYRVIAHGATDPGVVRHENQDSFCILEPADARLRRRKGILLVVADGMGGLAEGGTASKFTVEAMREKYLETEADAPAALKAAVFKANLLIHSHSSNKPAKEPMGSTVTALAIFEDHACIAHVGDSRAYRLTPAGSFQRLTRDHTWVEELARRGEIEPGSLQYSLNRNVLTRALGLKPEVEVDLVELDQVLPGDSFLLCSDGLYETLEDIEIESILKARGADLEVAVQDLIGLARSRGGPDNITVIAARVVASPTIETEGVSQVSLNRLPEDEDTSPRRDSLFPRSSVSLIFWVLAFAVGVGTVIFLEGRPPLPASEWLGRILSDPGYREVFQSPEGGRLREELSRLLESSSQRGLPAAENDENIPIK